MRHLNLFSSFFFSACLVWRGMSLKHLPNAHQKLQVLARRFEPLRADRR